MNIILNQKLKYRLIRYKRIIWHFFGFCPWCNSRVNYDRNCRAICPNCAAK